MEGQKQTRFEMTDIFRQRSLTKEGGCDGRNPGYGQSCHRAGLSTSGLWFLSVRNRGTIKPYDPVTTERADISAAQ